VRASARRIVYVVLCTLATFATSATAQQPLPQSAPTQSPKPQLRPDFGQTVGGGRPSVFMQVPVSSLFPGAVPTRPPIKNPNEGDPRSAQRGMTYFNKLNCVGCHADNGGGGMGPALSNRTFIYGSAPENIYLSIYQGRPNGMPAWGATLPDSIIWDLVTYIGHLSNEPSTEWGRTFSRDPLSPQVEQVPSEHIQTFDPWAHTKKFGMGQKP
jgi:cytochrome c oxidase cbb3-type subunit 3